MRPGLERIHGLLDVLADPHKGYAVIHVAGTNGKTSTTVFAAAILAAHDLTVGSFTSPHLRDVEERFALNAATMSPEELVDAVGDVAPLADLYAERSGEAVTYFELTTAIAFAWFAEKAVDVAVVEVGLGGRLDSTNVFGPTVAVVTGIGVDHTEYLGGELSGIAAEKVAILKPGGVLVSGPLPADAERAVAARVAETGAPWRRFGAEFRLGEPIRSDRGWLFDVDGVYEHYSEIDLGVRGRHQTRNFAIAVVACEELTGRALDEDSVRRAAAATSIPGRFEIAGRDPLVVLDGAHNVNGIETTAESLRIEFPGLRWVAVFGAMRDKDVPGMLRALSPVVEAVVATSVDDPRSMSVGEISELVSSLGLDAEIEHDVPAAVAAARDMTGPGQGVLVAGSLYVVGEAREALLRPP